MLTHKLPSLTQNCTRCCYPGLLTKIDPPPLSQITNVFFSDDASVP